MCILKNIKTVSLILLTSLVINPGIIYSQQNSSTWNGSVSKVWNNPANWSNGVPGVNTDVTIPWLPASAFQPEVNVNTAFKSLVMNSNPNTLTIGDDVEATISGKVTIGNSATLNVGSGILNVVSNFSTGGNFSFNEGTANFLGGFTYSTSGILFTGNGTINVGSPSASANLSVSGSNVFNLNNGTLNVYGTSSFSGSSSFVSEGAKVNFYGTTTVTGSSSLEFGNSNVNISGDVVVNGSGRINAESSNIKMEGALWQVSSVASFAPGESTMVFANNPIVINGGGGVTSVGFNNVMIEGGAVVTSYVNVIIYKNINVVAPASFNIVPNKTLNVVEQVIGFENIITATPYIISISKKDGNSYSLLFNIPLDSTSAQNPSNYKIVNSKGETVAIIKSAKRQSGANANIVNIIIEFNAKNTSEDLYLVANGIKSVNNTSLSSDHIKLLGDDIEPSPLPITLLSFSGKQALNAISLQWATASETNNDYFTIEKASDNFSEWTVIGYVNGAGNSNQVLKYSFTDDNPNYGLQYYRLKQTDFDGKFEYFTPIAVNYEQTAEIRLQLYPNPVHSSLIINREISNGENMNISITDINGKILMQEMNYQDNVFTTDVSGFKNGMYFVNVNIGNEFKQMRFIKSN